jgi:hypothetical protein
MRAYAIYAKQYGLAFVPPRYRRVEKPPFIPLDSGGAACYGGHRTHLGGTVINTLGLETKKQLKAWADGSRLRSFYSSSSQLLVTTDYPLRCSEDSMLS